MSYVEDAPVVTAAADYAELVVEWLPTCSPFVSDGDWCDITSYVASWDVKSGKDYFTDSIQTGTGKIVIRSTDRLFDSNNTAGPFYPWLTPMRQIRIREVWSGTDYTTWRGYITDYGETTLGADSLWETTLSVSDAWELAEHITLPNSYYEMIVSQDRPTHWWRLDESAATLTAADAGYGSPATGYYLGTPTLGSTGVVPYFGNRTCVEFSSNTYGTTDCVSLPVALSATNGYTIELWFTTTATGSTSYIVAGTNILVTTTGTFAAVAGPAVADGLPHHAVMAVSPGGATAMYLDSAAVTVPASVDLAILNVGYYTTPTRDYFFNGSLQSVAVWVGRTLTATQVADHFNAGYSAFSGDDTGTHIGRVLDAVGWPANLRSLGTGVSTVGAYGLAGGSLREHIAKMGDTELGQTYVSNDGKITHRARSSLYLDSRSSISQATFGDAHSSATLKFDDEDFSFPKDNTKIRNPVNAARSGGVTATARDDQLIQDTYANRSWDAPTAYDSDDNVMSDRANWLLDRHKEAHTRLESMRISPRRDPSNLWPQVLGRKIGDRITIERTPLGTGNQISSEQIIQSVRHAGTPKQRRAWYTATPDELTIPWILGDATYSVLDSTTVLGY